MNNWITQNTTVIGLVGHIFKSSPSRKCIFVYLTGPLSYILQFCCHCKHVFRGHQSYATVLPGIHIQTIVVVQNECWDTEIFRLFYPQNIIQTFKTSITMLANSDVCLPSGHLPTYHITQMYGAWETSYYRWE